MKLPFDQVYCLCLSDNLNRYKRSLKEFKRVGIDRQIHYWWTCKRSFSNRYAEMTPSLRTIYYDQVSFSRPNCYGNVWNCAVEHYDIIKTSLQRGFEHILIFEDDISFTASDDYFWAAIDNIPQDYDVLLFHNNERIKYHAYTFKPYMEEYKGKFFKTENPADKWWQTGTMMYALSKRAMEYIINLNDTEGLRYSDYFLSVINRQKYNIYEPYCKLVESKGESEIECYDN